ncbi:F-box protein SKP2A-like [Amphibalanus amphitrite]|nr:F-box protein SKP2A-like [Amphibalanus amphitrite]XP_043209816.1 F-box protein SKP2A-like [Amphibalanus amphitrite]
MTSEESPNIPLARLDSDMRHVDDLPTEILLHILSFLSLRQLLAVEHVSRRWRDAFDTCLSRLRDFTMHWPHALTDRCLELLLPRMSALRVIDIEIYEHDSLYVQINKLDLHIVAHHCPLLSELNLKAFRVSEPTLQRLCLRCPRLEVVTMNNNCSDECVKVMVLNQRRLRSLTICSPAGRCEWLATLPASVQRLTLHHWREREPGYIKHVAQCPNLRELDLSFSTIQFTSHLKLVLTGCVQLQRLVLAGTYWYRSNSRLATLLEAAPASLRELDISDVTSVTAEDLAAGLASCTRLERLSAAGLVLPPEGCLPVTGLPALRHLNLRRAEALTDTTLRRLPALLPGLYTLNINFCRLVSEEGLRCVRELPQLRALHLAGVPCVSSDVLDCLGDQPLAELELGCSETFPKQVGAEAVQSLVLRCAKLRRLTLYDRLSRVRAVVHALAGQLARERTVTLVLYPGFPSRLPRTDGPLRLTDTASLRPPRV